MSLSSAEGFTWDKLESTIAVMARNRAAEFDGVLTKVPDPAGFERINAILSAVRNTRVQIQQALIDMDGPLGPAYEGFSVRDRENLLALKAAGIDLAILSNNANDFKKRQADEVGVPIFGDGAHPKPSTKAYENPLQVLGWEAQKTAMFGDTAAMDKPFLGIDPKLRLSDLVVLKTLLTGWTPADPKLLHGKPQPNQDYHPRRDEELLAANFLVLPQKLSLGRVKAMREAKRRSWKLLINAQAKAVIAHHPGPITDEHLEALAA